MYRLICIDTLWLDEHCSRYEVLCVYNEKNVWSDRNLCK